MKSDIIKIDNQGNGFENAIIETKKFAEFRGLSHKDSVQLQLLAEEMLSMAHSVTGEVQASFWVECEEKSFDLNLSTQTVMDKEKRSQLISSATSRKNEITRSFLGKLRDAFEQAMTADVDHTYYDLPLDIVSDLPNNGTYEDPEWDGYERSVLRQLADNVKVAIRGGIVNLTVSKDFSK